MIPDEEKLPSAFAELGMIEDGWYVWRITENGTRAQQTKWSSDDAFSEQDKDMLFQFMEETVQGALDRDEQVLPANAELMQNKQK